jgi:hypothetical protein
VPGPAEIRAFLEFVLAARQDGTLPSPEMSEEGYVGNRSRATCAVPLPVRAGINIAGILCDGRIGACRSSVTTTCRGTSRGIASPRCGGTATERTA